MATGAASAPAVPITAADQARNRPGIAGRPRLEHAPAVPLRVEGLGRMGRLPGAPGVARRSGGRRLPRRSHRAWRRGFHPPSEQLAQPSAPRTVTRAQPIPPPMMASAAYCRASPVRPPDAGVARRRGSPPTIAPPSWQPRPSHGVPDAGWRVRRPQPTGAPWTRRLSACCFRAGCAGRKRRRSAGRTCRTRRTAAASWSTSAGRKPIRTAPRRTCAISRTDAPWRFASSATGSPYSAQGCARSLQTRCSGAWAASPSRAASPLPPGPRASKGASPGIQGGSVSPPSSPPRRKYHRDDACRRVEDGAHGRPLQRRTIHGRAAQDPARRMRGGGVRARSRLFGRRTRTVMLSERTFWEKATAIHAFCRLWAAPARTLVEAVARSRPPRRGEHSSQRSGRPPARTFGCPPQGYGLRQERCRWRADRR